MQIRRTVAAVASAFALAGAAANVEAQTSPVIGTWVFEQEVRTGPDSEPVKAEAVLTIEQQGDSLMAVWTLRIPGREPTPVTLRGKAEGNEVRLRGAPQQARLSGAGGERTIETVAHYQLRVEGDSITGTIQRTVLDGSAEIPSSQLKGKRKG